MQLPRQCGILVGGFGTRLGSLTTNLPKPLLDCGGHPFLAWVLRELSRFGVNEVVLLAGYKSETMNRFCLDAAAFLPRPMSIQVSIEPSPAGTGGAVWHARDLLDDTFLLINGDSWIDTNLARFMAESAATPGTLGCVLLHPMEDCRRYGTVELNGNHIVAFREKSPDSTSGIINSGIYVFNKKVLSLLSPKCSIEVDVLPVLAQKNALAGCVMDGYFIDIGIPADYARAGVELPQRLLRHAVFLTADTVLQHEIPSACDGRESLQWTDDAIDAICRITDLGAHAFVLTGRGDTLSPSLIQEVLRHGGAVDDQISTPAQTDLSDAMLHFLARWCVEPERAILIAKRGSDLQAAKAAKVEGHLHTGESTLVDLVDSLLHP